MCTVHHQSTPAVDGQVTQRKDGVVEVWVKSKGEKAESPSLYSLREIVGW